MSRTLSIIGIIVTFLYFWAIFYLFDGRIEEIRSMTPNNIGDFLAGVFGPLAILWLILGFFQKGIELGQNTRALELQAEELRNSVEQQKHLVEVNRKQVENELEVIRFEQDQQREAARPNFLFHGVGATFSGLDEASYSTSMKNFGNTATDINFNFDPPMKSSSITKVYSWGKGEEKILEWRYFTQMAESVSKLSISYTDAMGMALAYITSNSCQQSVVNSQW